MSEPGRATYLITTDLTGAAAAAVRYAWQNLEARFGLRAAQTEADPYVVFSSFGAPREREPAIGTALADAAATIDPFSLFLDGVSSAEGPPPELFLRVIKGGGVDTVFNTIFRAVSGVGAEIDPPFQPGCWLPNCTLARGDVKPEQVHAVRNYLRTQVLKWRSQVKTIHLLRVSEGGVERVETWALGVRAPVDAPPSFWT
jgi:hypothetical protein